MPYFLQLHLWCHRGPLLKHWLSLIRLWHCCSLCVPMVTMSGAYFPPGEVVAIIKSLISIFARSGRFFTCQRKHYNLLNKINWGATVVAAFNSSLQQHMTWCKITSLISYGHVKGDTDVYGSSTLNGSNTASVRIRKATEHQPNVDADYFIRKDMTGNETSRFYLAFPSSPRIVARCETNHGMKRGWNYERKRAGWTSQPGRHRAPR